MEKKEASYTVVECKLGQPLWEALQRFVKKLKTKTLHGLTIPLVGIYSEKMKSEVKVLVT